jgi:predicted nuclease of predicted toxin-antitoxin system
VARLYSNENFPLPVVEELRNLGHDVLTVPESGMANQALPDEEVLTFATRENRTVLTFNRKHFIQLHKAKPGHRGIIVCTFDIDFGGLANRIHTAIKMKKNLAGQLIRVNRPAP